MSETEKQKTRGLVQKWLQFGNAPPEIPGLTPFEALLDTRPLLPETENDVANSERPTEVVVPSNVLDSLLNQDFKCPVCLGPIDKTSTVTSCLHRFCKNCLEHALRMEVGPTSAKHHECPACRVKLASRRASKPDFEYDELLRLFHEAVKKSTDEYSDIGDEQKKKKQRTYGSEVKLLQPNGKIFQGNLSALSAQGRKAIGGSSSSSAVAQTMVLSTAAGMKRKGKAVTAALSSLATVSGAEEQNWMDLATLRELHKQKTEEFKARASKMLDARSYKIKRAHGAAVAAEIATVQADFKNDSRSSTSNLQHYQAQHDIAVKKAKKTPKVWLGLFPDPNWIPTCELLEAVNKENGNFDDDNAPMKLSRPYLKVPPKKNIADLKKYLLSKLHCKEDQTVQCNAASSADAVEEPPSLDDEQLRGVEVTLFIGTEQNKIELEDSLTILDVTERLWDGRSEFVLYFRLSM